MRPRGMFASMTSCVLPFAPFKLCWTRPQRLVRTLPQFGSRIVAASDAAQDAFRVGSGIFLVVTPRQERLGAVVPIDDAVFNLWDGQDTKIAQLELLMVLQGLLALIMSPPSWPWFVAGVTAQN